MTNTTAMRPETDVSIDDKTLAQPAPPMGHNNPPAFDPEILSGLTEKVNDFVDAAGAWKDLKKIDNREMSDKLGDYIVGSRGVYKEVDEARKKQKKPHDDAGKAVQAAFLPLLNKLDKAAKEAKKLQSAWLVEEQRRIDEERRKAEAEARAKAEAARKAAEEAERRNDISGQVDAEKEAKAAEKELKRSAKPQKAQAGTATGGGRTMSLRIYRFAKVTNVYKAFNAYKDAPEVIEVLERLATADLRASGSTFDAPGFEIVEEKRV